MSSGKKELDSSDEEDEDYVPSPVDSETEDKPRKKKALEQLKEEREEKKIERIWEEMQEPPLKKVKRQEQKGKEDDPVELAKRALMKLKGKQASGGLVTKSLKYAGKSYQYEGNKRDTQRKEKRLAGGLGAVDKLIAHIDESKKSNASTIQKSKLDWDVFVEKNKLAENLEKNRKGGGSLDKYLFKN